MKEDNEFLPGSNYIHYNPERIDYAISDAELEVLRQCSDNLWKDLFLAFTGIGAPCLVNAFVEFNRLSPFVANAAFTLNFIFGLVGVALGGAFCIAWQRSKKSSSQIVERIKGKPKMRLK